MTAHEVIQQIKTLPPQERAKVVDFVTKELRVKTMNKQTFDQASKQVFDRHAELMRRLSQ
ncbi:hypothetical protein DB347_10650 [Opitutaceae bacterium EW11]|nr:hypothetical protein DB347_10650 [Opitutaceae bacterium EW11]